MDTQSNFGYKIIPIKKPSSFDMLEKQELVHKFLYHSVKNEISFYTHKEYFDIRVYSVFGFYFLLSCDMAMSTYEEFIKLDDADVYSAYYSTTEQNDQYISQILRNSNTLEISEKNSYDNPDIKVVFGENGFVLCSKLNIDAEEKFERVILLFLVAMAYNLKVQTLLQDVSLSYKNGSYKEMIKKRDEIYAFDLNCFFANPVKPNRHQVYEIWNVIAKVYDTKNKHDEIKSQVIDLANVIEIQYKEKQEKIEKTKEKRLSIFLAIIAAASLISVINDFMDLIGR
jgi:hypothetical protein